MRQAYNARHFDDLESRAAQLRADKPRFANGSWRLVQFYDAFGCGSKEPETMWQLHDRIHQEWIAAKPDSIAARVAYADFLADYAWHARGSGYADTVTEEGWNQFRERLATAREVLKEGAGLAEKDPMWWQVALTVALGQGLPRFTYDQLVADAHAAEPDFWGYDTARAYSLLPRWHGKPGDWEAYAELAATRPDGPGAEIYARIVICQRPFYPDNIFRESRASWPRTREGLALLRERYPESLEFLSQSAYLATLAEDRTLAQEMFARLGDTYLPGVWRKPERFAHYRRWAQTGQW